MTKLVLDRTENIVGKAENAGFQHFLLFPQYFLKGFFLRVVKSLDNVVELINFHTPCQKFKML